MVKKTRDGYVCKCDGCGKTLISHLFAEKADAFAAAVGSAQVSRKGRLKVEHYHPECKP
jgi:hypothetical protein